MKKIILYSSSKQWSLLLTLLCITLTGLHAHAYNKLSIPDVTVGQGTTIALPVNLDNDDPVVALQFTLTIPEGFKINTSFLEPTNRADDHVLRAQYMGDHKYECMLYSPSNAPLNANHGTVFNMMLTASAQVDEGAEFEMLIADAVASNAAMENVLDQSSAGHITISRGVDLLPSALLADAAEYHPGDHMLLSWIVSNVGQVATDSGWTERLELVDGDGNVCSLGSVYYDGILTAGGEVSRQAEVIIPNLNGLADDITVQVTIVPDIYCGERVEAQANNTAIGTEIALYQQLYLEVPSTSFPEGYLQAVKCRVSRSGYWNDALTVNLFSEESRLDIPVTVTIPATQSAIDFYVNIGNNSEVDDNDQAVFVATALGYDDVTATLSIEDDELRPLYAASSLRELTEGDDFTITVTTDKNPSADVVINLTCSLPARFTYPKTVTIPAGESSATVVISAVDDATPDVDQEVTFALSAERYQSDEVWVTLHDNDVPDVELTLTPSTVSEIAGPNAVIATLKRLNRIDNAITFILSDDSGGLLRYSSSQVSMTAGVNEVQFAIGVNDNDIVEGDRLINVTAAIYIKSCSCQAQGGQAGSVTRQLTVTDNDGPTITITSSRSTVAEGTEAMLTISRNANLDQALAVSLSSDDDTGLTYAHQVTIPAGEKSVTLPLAVAENDVTDDSRVVTIQAVADGFSTGTCWLMISNQTLPDAQVAEFALSQNEVEIGGQVTATVTVTNTGSAPLPSQTRVSVYLDDGTELCRMFTQTTIVPGNTEVMSKAFSVPEKIGAHEVYAVVNDGLKVKELITGNNSSQRLPLAINAPFSTTLTVEKSVYKMEETINFNGVATGQGVTAGTRVEVYVIYDGYRQTIVAETDADGRFMAQYTPYVSQMGHFTAGACYPGENATREMTSFDIVGMRRTNNGYIACDMLLGEPYTVEIGIENPSQVALNNVHVGLLSQTDNYDLSFSTINMLAGGAKGVITAQITGNAVTARNEWEQAVIEIVSDEGARIEMTLFLYCRNPRAQLKADVTTINTTMIKGQSRDYTFYISNIGKANTGKITLSLPDWMSTATPSTMASLAQGESAQVVLRLTPTDDMPLNVPRTGSIAVNCENGSGITIPYRIEPVSETTGTLVVDVCDEYTYNTAIAPHVQGATVQVKHPTTGAIVAQGVTNAEGIFTAVLPEGYYTLYVTADKHDSYANNILIDPGRENTKTINLSFQAITVSWEVKETTVEDQYDIVTTVTYETNVPVPVVVLDMPDRVNCDDLQVGESLIFYATLTNKGLITAQDVELTLPTGFKRLQFRMLSTLPKDLLPGQAVMVPIMVTRVLPAGGSELMLRASDGDEDPCIGYTNTICWWDCGNDRKWHQYKKTIQFTYCPLSDDGGGIVWPGGGGLQIIDDRQTPPNNPLDWDVSWLYDGPERGSEDPVPGIDLPEIKPKGCIPCVTKLTAIAVHCWLKRYPIYDFVWEIIGWVQDPEGKAADYVTGELMDRHRGMKPVYGLVKKLVDYLDNFDECIKPLLLPCDPGEEAMTLHTPKRTTQVYPSYVLEYQNKLNQFITLVNNTIECLSIDMGGDGWLQAEPEELYDFWTSLSGWVNDEVSDEQLSQSKPAYMSDSELEDLKIRWKNTVNNVDTDNRIDEQRFTELAQENYQILDSIHNAGYETVTEFLQESEQNLLVGLQESSEKVCATISLQFSQRMVMTRQAFRGTLKVYNGHDSIAMRDVKLLLTVTDENGKLATSHEFHINPESLTGFEGEMTLDAGWSLEAGENGVATILFIPTKYAAPTVAVPYTFSGVLTYIDPFTGELVTRNLVPQTLTVKPSADLELDYFIQRDVFGDDPLTEQVEPMIPAEFALLINNKGYGDATNVSLTTAQPVITGNKKGLQIDFTLCDGKEHDMYFDDIVNVFDTIAAKSQTYAQWWLTSSLTGHFTSYEASYTHVTSYDNPDLSLIDTVRVHELIHGFTAGDDGQKPLRGFLVNDLPDANDLPDVIHFTDATDAPVSLSTATITRKSSTQYWLTVNAGVPGWNYGSVLDPTLGRQALVSIVRQSDGQTIAADNVWATDRTLRDGRDPLYENRLHYIVDIAGATETYLLTFETRPDVELEVMKFSGVPDAVLNEPLQSLTVTFNKAIDPSTFTTDDITMACQGLPVDVAGIVINALSTTDYELDLSSVTAADGYYVLTVQTAAITDAEGYNGSDGKSAAWIQFNGGMVPLTIAVEPVQGGTVLPESGDFFFNSTIHLTAQPSPGYVFLYWMDDEGNVISNSPEYDYPLLNASRIVAVFEPINYRVTVVYDPNQGNVTGAGAEQILAYGTQIVLSAQPAVGHEFYAWLVNGRQHGSDTELTIVVEEDLVIEALFKKVDAPEPTYPPIITTEVTPDMVIITATGDGEVLLYVNGQPVENPCYVPRDSDDMTIIVTATAQEPGKAISETVTVEVVIPRLISALDEVIGDKTVAAVRYFNMMGQEMDGVAGATIMVVYYTDGTISTLKVLK